LFGSTYGNSNGILFEHTEKVYCKPRHTFKMNTIPVMFVCQHAGLQTPIIRNWDVQLSDDDAKSRNHFLESIRVSRAQELMSEAGISQYKLNLRYSKKGETDMSKRKDIDCNADWTQCIRNVLQNPDLYTVAGSHSVVLAVGCN
jgi:hypothetical protein